MNGSRVERERVCLPGCLHPTHLVEFEHMDDGPYGWKAESVSFVGVREYAATKDAARQAIAEHIQQERSLIRREALRRW